MRKLSEIVVKSGSLVFREIVHVALYSMVTSAFLLPLVFLLQLPIALLLLPLVYAPLATGVVYASHSVMNGKRAKVKDVFLGAGRHFGASAVFGYVCALFLLILASSWWYYGGRGGMLHFGLAIFQTYFVGMFFLSQTYTLSLVVQEGMGIFSAMGRSVKLFMAHPMYTIGAFIQLLSVGVLLLLTVIGFAFLFLGIAGFYLNAVTANVLPKKDEEEAGGPGVGGIGEKGTWSFDRQDAGLLSR